MIDVSHPDNLTDVPPSDAYREALLRCRDDMCASDFAMLEAHWRAPDHTITAGEVARAVGFKNFNGANLRYGLLAARLCEALGRKPKYHIAIFATFTEDEPLGSEFIQWTMLPELVSALEELRLVGKSSK